MTSKTKIEKKLRRKEKPSLVRLIILLKKQKKAFWLAVANLLASPKRKSVDVNIEKINRLAKDNETIVVPGKVLSQGELSKNVTIASYNASQSAKEKLKSNLITIEELLKKNPSAKGARIII